LAPSSGVPGNGVTVGEPGGSGVGSGVVTPGFTGGSPRPGAGGVADGRGRASVTGAGLLAAHPARKITTANEANNSHSREKNELPATIVKPFPKPMARSERRAPFFP
jgi:hypothetical protein